MSLSTPHIDLGSIATQKMLTLGMPAIRGTWFFVDPLAGSSTGDGRTIATAVDSIKTAYALCTTNVGDGICILSSDADTVANTTSFLKETLTWAKNSITVFGVDAPTRTFQRSRICSKQIATTSTAVVMVAATQTITRGSGSFINDGWEVGMQGKFNNGGTNANVTFTLTAVSALVLTATVGTDSILDESSTSHTLTSYQPSVIEVSGSNNSFYNLMIMHEGSHALGLTSLKVSGNRNYFKNIHAAIGIASANTDLTRSLWLSACQENTFVKCTFGTDTVDRGGQATYDIYLSGAVARNKFFDCETIRQSSSGTGCLAVYADTTTGGRPTLFKNCIFSIWNTAGGNANCSYMGASTGNCDRIWLAGCVWPGYADMSNDAVFYTSSTYSANENVGLFYT